MIALAGSIAAIGALFTILRIQDRRNARRFLRDYSRELTRCHNWLKGIG